MIELSQAMKDHIAEYSAKLAKYPKLRQLYENCYPNTLETATEILEDGKVFVLTGDIPAMWLRDSSAQVNHYIPFAKESEEAFKVISGLIARQIDCILHDAYANAFNREANGKGHQKDKTEMSPLKSFPFSTM